VCARRRLGKRLLANRWQDGQVQRSSPSGNRPNTRTSRRTLMAAGFRGENTPPNIVRTFGEHACEHNHACFPRRTSGRASLGCRSHAALSRSGGNTTTLPQPARPRAVSITAPPATPWPRRPRVPKIQNKGTKPSRLRPSLCRSGNGRSGGSAPRTRRETVGATAPIPHIGQRASRPVRPRRRSTAQRQASQKGSSRQSGSISGQSGRSCPGRKKRTFSRITRRIDGTRSVRGQHRGGAECESARQASSCRVSARKRQARPHGRGQRVAVLGRAGEMRRSCCPATDH
jgi:hypothetical protein